MLITTVYLLTTLIAVGDTIFIRSSESKKYLRIDDSDYSECSSYVESFVAIFNKY